MPYQCGTRPSEFILCTMVVPSYRKEEKKKEYERLISFGNSKRTNPHLIIQDYFCTQAYDAATELSKQKKKHAQDGVYQRKPRTARISTTLDYGSGHPVLISFLVSFPLACLVLCLVLTGTCPEKDLGGDLPTLTTPPQNHKAAILWGARLWEAGCSSSLTWRHSLTLTPARTKHHQLPDTAFGGISRGNIKHPSLAPCPWSQGRNTESEQKAAWEHKRKTSLPLPSSSSAAESLDLLLINPVLETDYRSADSAVSASLHLMQK